MKIARIFLFKELRPVHWLVIFIVFTAIHIPSILNYRTNENLYAVMANAFMQGKLYIPVNDPSIGPGPNAQNDGDMIYYQGKYYSAYPPAPAFLLLPFIAVFGGVNPILIAVLLTCLNIFLLYSILQKLRIKEYLIPWLIYGFIFGTGYWYVLLTSHHMYGFAQIVSLSAVFLFLNELFGKRRSGLLGLFLGISFLCRQFTIILGLFGIGYFIYYYLSGKGSHDIKTFWKKTILFSCITGCSIILIFLYNYARFGNALDTGYQYMNYIGIYKVRVAHHGVFSVHYVLVNIYNYLLSGFHIELTGPGAMQIKDMDLFGSAFITASPFLIAAFKTGWNRWLRLFAWISIGIMFTGLLFYHSNGKNQVNTSRYVLDFLPLMLIMAGLGADKLPRWLFKGLVLYAIVINVIAYVIHFKYHTLERLQL